MIVLAGFVLVFLVLPNTINIRERNAFSDAMRLECAQKQLVLESELDSISVISGPWYDRGKSHYLLFGENYRELWNTPVKVPVLKLEQEKGGLELESIGGGQQTIGVDLEDAQGREWALRSINKDQSKALPKYLRPTLLRFMFRDQAAALNPYGSLAVPVLADAIDILHTHPQLVYVPYNDKDSVLNHRMAGRLAILVEDADGSWAGAEVFGEPERIEDTEDMLELVEEEGYPIDTMLYAKSRLFDILISDWDRHEGNWNWALVDEGGQKVFKPLPRDRDMAFYRFGEGLLPKITLMISDKFQSFEPNYKNIKGLTKQSIKMDRSILQSVSLPELLRIAREIQQDLPDTVIQEAFQRYPEEVYKKIGQEHEEVLKARRDKLPEAAQKFWEIIQKKAPPKNFGK